MPEKPETAPKPDEAEIEKLVREAFIRVRRRQTVILRPEPRPPKPPASS
jgi:hypothetical protein